MRICIGTLLLMKTFLPTCITPTQRFIITGFLIQLTRDMDPKLNFYFKDCLIRSLWCMVTCTHTDIHTRTHAHTHTHTPTHARAFLVVAWLLLYGIHSPWRFDCNLCSTSCSKLTFIVVVLDSFEEALYK